MVTDILVQNEGSIFLLHPMSEAGKSWLAENTPAGDETQYFGEALVVEHRYVRDVVDGIIRDGLVVK